MMIWNKMKDKIVMFLLRKEMVNIAVERLKYQKSSKIIKKF